MKRKYGKKEKNIAMKGNEKKPEQFKVNFSAETFQHQLNKDCIKISKHRCKTLIKMNTNV
jgi:hypothetical protein